MNEFAGAHAEKPKRGLKEGFLNFLGLMGRGVELATYEASGLSEEIVHEIEAHWPEQPEPMDSAYSTENLVRAAASTEIKLP